MRDSTECLPTLHPRITGSFRNIVLLGPRTVDKVQKLSSLDAFLKLFGLPKRSKVQLWQIEYLYITIECICVVVYILAVC
jgi:hypothetical protein